MAGDGDAGGGRGATPASDDWPTQLLDRLDGLIAKVRSQSTDRVVRIARLVVFGMVAVVMGAMAAILLVIALVRAADRLIPQEVWLAYLVLGGLMTGAGVFLWSKKGRRPAG